jgi:predicted DNA-binding transcriptional regulator AlpA
MTAERPDLLSGGDLLDGEWLSTEEVAKLLGVDPSTIRRWRTARPAQGPPFVRLSSRVTVYSMSDVRRWLEQRRTDPERARDGPA